MKTGSPQAIMGVSAIEESSFDCEMHIGFAAALIIDMLAPFCHTLNDQKGIHIHHLSTLKGDAMQYGCLQITRYFDSVQIVY